MAFLGPFFFATYGGANWLASQRAHVPAAVFGWEDRFPFLPWTIYPYWSIDLLYAVSVLFSATRRELDRLGRRLLTTQVLAVTCFVLFPLRFTFVRPETEGLAGVLFDMLGGFDKPFNQAPSLHIALLVVLWVHYAPKVPGWARWPFRLWMALIGVSVLTTWQHHFIDVPTGAWLGLFVLWLWPEQGRSPLAGFRIAQDPRRRHLALRYAGGAVALTGVGVGLGGSALWLLWPAASLLLVALGYAALGPGLFQKDAAGRHPLAVRWLLGPYLIGAAVNARLWTGDGRRQVALADGVSIGRVPDAAEAARFATVIDCTAEIAGRGGSRGYVALPMLDLATPEPAALRDAASAIERARPAGPVLVCCALGYSRSAAAAASWLVATGRAPDAEAAIACIRAVRPHIRLGEAAQAAIAAAGR
jgi:hypothetical protein